MIIKEIIREIEKLSIEDRMSVIESTIISIQESSSPNQIKEATET